MNCNKPSPDIPSFDKKEEEVMKDNKRKKSIYEVLKNDKREVLLKNKKRTFEPIWKSDASGYLQKVRGYSLLLTKNQEIKRKKKLEKSTSNI